MINIFRKSQKTFKPVTLYAWFDATINWQAIAFLQDLGYASADHYEGRYVAYELTATDEEALTWIKTNCFSFETV